MERLEPTVIGLAALLARARDNLHHHLVGRMDSRCASMRNPKIPSEAFVEKTEQGESEETGSFRRGLYTASAGTWLPDLGVG